MPLPAEILDDLRKKIIQAAKDAAYDAVDEIKVKAEDVVSDWQNKPSFDIQVTSSQKTTEYLLKASGRSKDIWTYIDLGTGTWGKNHAPYPIYPKTPGGLLKFKTGYSAKTSPSFGRGTGTASGPWVSTPFVLHPGIKSRNFMKHWFDDLSPSVEDRVAQYIQKAIS